MQATEKLIFDIGVSEGDDTNFYLKKGFRVIGVEADPTTFEKARLRFGPFIKTGKLTLLNRAAFSRSDEQISFFCNREAQGHSALAEVNTKANKPGELVSVRSVDWQELVRQHGVPYFCKIDIEGAEPAFMSGFAGSMPEFISVECHKFEPIEKLYQLGYRKFKLVNQTILNTFRPPSPPLEGSYLPQFKFGHSSGYFGKETPGPRWLSIDEIGYLYRTLQALRAYGSIIGSSWFDCHAWAS